MNTISWLKKPYFFLDSPKLNSFLSFGAGFFVFLFLYIFKPFCLGNLSNNLLFYTGGFGLVTFITQSIFFIILPFIFKRFFNDEFWNVGKNIIFLLFLILSITFANYYYNKTVQNTESIKLKTLSDFLIYTFSLAAFPIVFLTYITEKLYRKKREKISNELMKFKVSNVLKTNDKKIKIFGTNKKENIDININDLVYITSQGNYVSFFILSEKGLIEKVIRNTLSTIENDLKKVKTIVRCHKSYIINTKFIDSISGNARGYFLESTTIPKQIPVSRKFKKEDLKNLIK